MILFSKRSAETTAMVKESEISECLEEMPKEDVFTFRSLITDALLQFTVLFAVQMVSHAFVYLF